jgi:hypothetical protein
VAAWDRAAVKSQSAIRISARFMLASYSERRRVGAMAGGVLEYVSMLTGMRSVWLLVLAIYLLAWLFARRARVQDFSTADSASGGSWNGSMGISS